MWFGKIIGALAGLAVGGPFGAILGAVVGHTFDKGLKLRISESHSAQHGRGHRSQQEGADWQSNNDEKELPDGDIQAAFFKATFLVMGKLAKIDGRVSDEEIGLAKSIMDQLQLSAAMKRHAVELFSQGKQENFDLGPILQQFHSLSGRRANLIQMFMEIQCQVAHIDGVLHVRELHLIEQVAECLYYPKRNLEQLLRRYHAFYSGGHEQQHRTSSSSELAQSYGILGVEESVSAADLKKAYRRLMSQHHPDKLVAKGLPEEMMALATAKTQQIQSAYDLIQKHRQQLQ